MKNQSRAQELRVHYMKTFLSAVMISYCLSCDAQVPDVSGYYAGEFSTDSVCIHVCFDLKKDHTYRILLSYNFIDYCVGKGKDTLQFDGKWETEKEWLFLNPFDKGIDVFYQYETRSKHDKRIIAKHAKTDMVPLEIEFANDCPRIYFRLNSECFKDAWKYNYIEKISCQAEAPKVEK
jgi:hypothetical protein